MGSQLASDGDRQQATKGRKASTNGTSLTHPHRPRVARPLEDPPTHSFWAPSPLLIVRRPYTLETGWKQLRGTSCTTTSDHLSSPFLPESPDAMEQLSLSDHQALLP